MRRSRCTRCRSSRFLDALDPSIPCSLMREILIADDHPLFRDALKRALAQAVPEAAAVRGGQRAGAADSGRGARRCRAAAARPAHARRERFLDARLSARPASGPAGRRRLGPGGPGGDPPRDRARRVRLHSEIGVGRHDRHRGAPHSRRRRLAAAARVASRAARSTPTKPAPRRASPN